jgi:hypothetical protein
MSAPLQHLNPSDLSDEALGRLAFAIAGVLSKHGVWHERPLAAKDAMSFMNIGRKKFYSLINKGIIKEHRPDPDGHAWYFPSEIVEGIKNKKR